MPVEPEMLRAVMRHWPTGVAVKDSDVRSLPPRDVVCLVTGSQGEPNAALSRIAIDDHRHISLGPDDTVVLSARAIPGNEKAIGRVVNHLSRRGVDVVTEETRHVHVWRLAVSCTRADWARGRRSETCSLARALTP